MLSSSASKEVSLSTMAASSSADGSTDEWAREVTLEGANGPLTVGEVYGMAATIGQEFEIIIDRYGPDTVCGLMSKVIHVLEDLEDQAARRQSQQEEFVSLQAAVERLQSDKVAKGERKQKAEQDMLKIEETWRAETSEQLQIITRLIEENHRLCTTKVPPSSSPATASRHRGDDERQLILRLKDIVDAQKVDLRCQRHQLAQTSIDLDAMQQQATRLAHLSVRTHPLRRPTHVFCASTIGSYAAGSTAFLADQLKQLETRLLAKRALVEEMRKHVRSGQQQQLREEPASSYAMSASMHRELISPGVDEKTILQACHAGGLLRKPNAPPAADSFSYDELRSILVECMLLQSQVIQVSDQLEVYRSAGDDDPPVQGPIDREPADKLLGGTDIHGPLIGVKQFFQALVDRLTS